MASNRFSQTEHRNADGRTYWYNTNSKESVWEKPEGECALLVAQGMALNAECVADVELKTPFEVCSCLGMIVTY